MYNDEELLEVEDFDQDISLRKELIEEAKQIEMNDDWNEINQRFLKSNENGKGFLIVIRLPKMSCQENLMKF